MLKQNNNGSGSRMAFLDVITHTVSGTDELSFFLQPGAIPSAFYMNIHRMSHPEICFVVAQWLLGDEIDAGVLKDIIFKAYNYPLPLIELSERLYTLDFSLVPDGSYMAQGGLFISKLIACLRKGAGDTRDVTTLVISTPESGLILAKLFAYMPTVKAVCIFTRGTLDRTLAAAMRAQGPQIFPMEINSDLRDCLSLISRAQTDRDITDRIFLTTVTPSNPAITFTRVFQYFQAYAQFVSLRKAKNLSGDSIFHKGLVFLIPDNMPASVNAVKIALELGLPESRYEIFSPDEVKDPESLLSEGEFGIIIPGIGTDNNVFSEKHGSHVTKIPATFPAFKRYILSILK